VIVAIDENGKIYRCDVARSSGVAELDDESCAVMRTEGRFAPAKDRTGQAIPSEVSQSIVWDVPGMLREVNAASNFDAIIEVQRLPESKRFLEIHIREIVDAEGHVESCALDKASGATALDQQACRLVASAATVPPLRDPDSRAVRGMRVRRIAFLAQVPAAK